MRSTEMYIAEFFFRTRINVILTQTCFYGKIHICGETEAMLFILVHMRSWHIGIARVKSHPEMTCVQNIL